VKDHELLTDEIPDDNFLYYIKIKRIGGTPLLLLDRYKDGRWETFTEYNKKMKNRYEFLGWMKWQPDKGIYLE
jgi:hypothetical protein